MITRDNLHAHEIIGLDAQIIQSGNLQLVGIHGKIIDETKNMFTLKTESGIKDIPKNKTIWRFSMNGLEKELNGSKLTKRSHERLGGKI